MNEQSVWKGHPSHLVNLGLYVLCILLCFLIVPLFVAFWVWLKTRSNVYQVTTERVLRTVGIFSRVTDTLELYRVKDLRVDQPLSLRIFGLCTIVLLTSDHTNSVFTVPAVKFNLGLQDKIRALVEQRRDVKHVREIDLE
ncbi:MAG: PH domain-containing protein [Candidatus Hydrogenedentes bacterium]|nr:PH domain-containing protein [Candidatus Hydrogenedentota bacterium]